MVVSGIEGVGRAPHQEVRRQHPRPPICWRRGACECTLLPTLDSAFRLLADHTSQGQALPLAATELRPDHSMCFSGAILVHATYRIALRSRVVAALTAIIDTRELNLRGVSNVWINGHGEVVTSRLAFFQMCRPAVGSAIAPIWGGRLRFSTSVGLRVRRSHNSLRVRLNPAATRATALISSSQFHFGNGRDRRSAPGRSFQDEWSWSKHNSHSDLRIL